MSHKGHHCAEGMRPVKYVVGAARGTLRAWWARGARGAAGRHRARGSGGLWCRFHCRHHLPTISGGEGAGAALPLNPHYLHDHPPCPRSQPNLRDRNSSHEIGAILIAYEDLGYVPHNLTVGFNRDSIQESIDALSLIFCLEFNSNKSFSPLVSVN